MSGPNTIISCQQIRHLDHPLSCTRIDTTNDVSRLHEVRKGLDESPLIVAGKLLNDLFAQLVSAVFFCGIVGVPESLAKPFQEASGLEITDEGILLFAELLTVSVGVAVVVQVRKSNGQVLVRPSFILHQVFERFFERALEDVVAVEDSIAEGSI